ncbi:hypothetical protein BC939DRAFT_501831 [Gamsiella multidivaricata]|uniref:uncharacterized protein n=1 Tax=Gamsiella multidivaricata TaxID=101098 RepID=UPI00221E5343|nr:uncharacterized protein BC939DRAFT_501831 [Gamsiella multidivaricata]KAI7826144.1 hypothetical protein BC939DRAFT_501831 [Gamsiella multidivaricata]
MPSPLVLPHHRRIVQKMATTHSIIYNDGSNVNMNISPGAGNTVQPIPIVDRSIVPELHSNPQASSTHTSPTGNETLFTAMMRTPASTPSISNVSSFQSTIPPSVSQVISSSTTPLTMIQHHIPTTTLMHHPPAVYWKHQVVEWLEQEKLRCLRLGLFWRFNAAAASAHAERKLRGTH